MNKIRILAAFLFLCSVTIAQEIKAPYWDNIQAFKKQDSLLFPPKHAILFIGSSSFTKWTDMQDYFRGYKIINRGFGGSTITDVIRYAGVIIIPYQPKQVVLYCGENDLASSDTVSARMVFHRFETLFNLIRKNDPEVAIAFISLKPSPSRKWLWPKMIETNELIKNYLNTKNKTSFIDVYHQMFNKDGTVMTDIFIDDQLHLNKKGYQLWQKAIEPYLIKSNIKN